MTISTGSGQVKTPAGALRSRWKRGILLAVALALVAVASLYFVQSRRAATDGTAEPSPGAPAGLSADPILGAAKSRVNYAQLDQRIARLMQEPNMVGLAVGTIENGQVRFVKGYGETVAGSRQPVTRDTVFRWGSLSKGVASALVTKLAGDGKFSLDTPVAALRTTLRLPGASQNVSVADVLSHRVGIVRNAWDDRLEAGEDPRVIRSQLATLPPYCPPSTCYAYQNIAYDMASEIVRDATGEEYGIVARDALFRPLGMTQASVGRAGLQSAASWARPYRYNKQPTVVNDIYYGVPAAGGVNSSIRDLVKWMRAQMGDAPAVLAASALETMHRPRVATPPHGPRSAMDKALTHAQYGLGWRSFDYAGHHLVGHRGTVDGYGSLILFDPVDRSGIVMLWNCNWGRPARLQLEFFDMLYGLPPTDWLDLDPK